MSPQASFFAARLAQVKPSPTFAMIKLIIDMKAAGRRVLGLANGEPDFDTPQFIKDAAMEAMRRGDTKYTAVEGTPALRQAICDKFKRENHLEYGMKQIIVSNGGKQVIFNAMLATLNAGDEVIIPAPYWVSYPDMVALADGQPVIVPTTFENGFKISPAALENAITPKTKWLILNSPSNPTGAAYTKQDLYALAEVLMRYPHVWILADDMYEHMIYDNFEFYSMAQVEPRLYDRTLTVNGVSKTYSMTGWRIGYAGGPEALIKKMIEAQGHMTACPSSISQAAALAAITGPQEFLTGVLETFKQRRDMLVDMMNAIPGITCLKPQGAFYAYPSCAGLIGSVTPEGKTILSDDDFAAYLLESEGVAVVSGSGFGMSPNIRISYATATDLLKEGCEAIQRACARLTGGARAAA